MWLNDCINNHDGCKKAPPFLPSRVIDVGPSDGSQEPFLCETGNLQLSNSQQSYTALSYCWGKTPFITTTLSTLPARRRQILFRDMPATFQDAVTVSRQMNIRYLWIDALCIIQDSQLDWRKESVQMCKIYQHALFTITSAHSSDAYGGLFAKRDGTLYLPFEIVIPLLDREAHFLFSPFGREDVPVDPRDLPINTRAWTLQELVLSKRTLIYDPGMLRWECHSMRGSESFPMGGIVRHDDIIKRLQKAIASTETHNDIFDFFGKTIRQQSSEWQHIIENYSSRNLSKYSDKLMALSGIVQALLKRTSNVYLAGLWKKQLYMQLLWSVNYSPIELYGGTRTVFKPPPYRAKNAVAPSWSWASLTVPVDYVTGMPHLQICDILNTHVDGPLHRQTGSIVLCGDTRILHVMNNSKSLWAEAESLLQSSKYTYIGPVGLPVGLDIRSVMLASIDRPSFFSSVEAIPAQWKPDELIDPNTPVTFVAIAMSHRRSTSGIPSDELEKVHTLALVSTGHTDGEYRRVGYAAWDACSWYGFDCAERRGISKIYQALSKTWGRIKPPVLCAHGTHIHPVVCNPLPVREAYHPSVKVRRATLTIV